MTEALAPPQTAVVDGTLAADALDAAPVRDASARAATSSVSFVSLYREHFAYVWRALRRLGIRDADLPDLTHDVFVVVYRKLADFDVFSGDLLTMPASDILRTRVLYTIIGGKVVYTRPGAEKWRKGQQFDAMPEFDHAE